LKKTFKKFDRLHGSRDYFQIKEKDFTFEIVPIVKISKAEQALNITDISPLHAKWVNKNGKKFFDDIRLTKAFCKANQIYGAESYIKGFSGYVLEILTIHYKGFDKLIKNIAKWDKQTIIDIEKHYKDKGEILRQLNKAKKHSPLIIIDPVQKQRNAAAALGNDMYENFIQFAKAFAKKPSEKFFEKKPFSLEKLEKKHKKHKIILLKPSPLKGKRDVIGSKLLKSLEYIVKQSKLRGFTVIDSGWEWNENKDVLFWIVCKDEILSEFQEYEGPPIRVKKHFNAFKKKHKKTVIKNKRIYAKVKTEHREIEHYIKTLKKDKWFNDKLKW